MELQPGQVAVVTGGASGLGLALAEAFARRGVRVVVADVEAGPLADAVARIEASGADALGRQTDVGVPEQVDALAAATVDRFGRVDIICNNAGVSTLGPHIWEVPLADWDWVLRVNLGSVINGIRAFVPHFVAQGSGHVVNTASMAGVSVPPMHGPYLASKHAVVALSESLALELSTVAPGVGVTVVCPGVIDTNIQYSGRNRPDGSTNTAVTLDDDDFATVHDWTRTISAPSLMPAADAADIVLRAIEADRLHVAPNGLVDGVRARVELLMANLVAT
jgi:NAD(P)-dependent dehydrogenase (short-subunit alcohol dehydrogenase family)